MNWEIKLLSQCSVSAQLPWCGGGIDNQRECFVDLKFLKAIASFKKSSDFSGKVAGVTRWTGERIRAPRELSLL
jgi:hypothetical protein